MEWSCYDVMTVNKAKYDKYAQHNVKKVMQARLARPTTGVVPITTTVHNDITSLKYCILVSLTQKQKIKVV